MSFQKSKSILGVLVVLFYAIACDTLPPLPDSVKLGVNPPEVTIPAEGGTATVSFSSPLVWQASSSESWLRITPLTGEAGDITITLSADENTAEEQRTATVTVSIVNYDRSETVKVIQLGKKAVEPTPPDPPAPEEPEEIEGFTATLGDWAAGESVSIGITIEQEIKDVEWAVYLPVEEAAIPMEKGQDGLYRARITGHYPLMPIYFARGGKAVFGSVYTYSYIPWEKDVAEVSLIYTSESSHAVYVDSDRALDVVLDPSTLKASFVAVEPQWTSIGKGWFTDGMVYPLLGLESPETELEFQQDATDPSRYRIPNPYEALSGEELIYYPDLAEIIFCIKPDNTVYIKECCLGFRDAGSMGLIYGMSLVPENGWRYNYYGKWDSATKTAVFEDPTATYVEGEGYYYSNRNGEMKIILPGGAH